MPLPTILTCWPIPEQAIYRSDAYEGFFYPPVFLMLCVPFAVLPYFASLAAFLGATGTAYFAALLRAGRSAWLAGAGLRPFRPRSRTCRPARTAC